MKSIIAVALVCMLGFSISTTCEDKSQCADGSTCCLLQSGSYGCCPYNAAVCCADKLHCCPHGTKCDVAQGTCTSSESNMFYSYVNLTTKPLTFLAEDEPVNHQCKDGTSCSGQATCCKYVSGGYACCPYGKATCCADNLHCCPHGTKCDLAHGMCLKQGSNDFFMYTELAKKDAPLKNSFIDCVKEMMHAVKEAQEIIFSAIKNKTPLAKVIAELEQLVGPIKKTCKKIIGTPAELATKAASTIAKYGGIIDVFRCIKDIVPSFEDIWHAIQDYRHGKKTNVWVDLKKLLVDGAALLMDCIKIIK